VRVFDSCRLSKRVRLVSLLELRTHATKIPTAHEFGMPIDEDGLAGRGCAFVRIPTATGCEWPRDAPERGGLPSVG
jgi:hypothetical protein